ncbi:MAG TPA: FHA domain-containing protein [Myxococcales bacterium]|nr:FHA domain-containing protein [Myxococcales bacterium]
MSLCASCGRSLPCGCPDPKTADGKLTDLFGLVCPSCDAYNEPSRMDCVDCGSLLEERLVPASAIDSIVARPSQRTQPSVPVVLEPTQISKVPPQVTDPVMAPEGEVEEVGEADLLPPEAPGIAAALPPDQMPQPWSMDLPSTPPPAAAPIKTPVVNALPLIAAKAVPAPARAAPTPTPTPSTALLLTQQAAVKPVQLLTPTPAQPLGRACARCGTTNPADYKFCGSCGASLARATDAVPVAKSRQLLAPGRASARVLRGERLGQVLPIGMQANIGRGTCELSFPRDPYLSASHCELVFDHGRLLLRDRDGSSGTFVRIYDEENLGPGDFFSLGDHLMRFAGPLPVPVAAEDGTKISGGPRPPADAVKLEELHEGMLPGRTVVRRGPQIVLGRDDGCEVSFPGDRFVSSRHCALTLGASGRARIKDLGSTNGTFLRMAPGGERELFKGDCVRVGGEVLQLVET